jgi:hypothetical protein
MDGQARVSGLIYKDVKVGDKTYRLSKPNLVGIYGEVEAWIINRKQDPLVLAVQVCKGDKAKGIPPAPASLHATIWEAAMKSASAARIASPEELDTFWNSRWSNAFLFLKALDPKHSDEVPDIEAAMRVIEEGVDVDMLLAQISVVNGEADLKNSSGQSATLAANQPMETPALADGQDSTSSSPSVTIGLQSR